MDDKYLDEKKFKQTGLLIKRGFFSKKEVSLYQNETLNLWENQKDINSFNLRIGLRKNIDGEVVFERLDPVSDISEVFNSLNNDERLSGIVDELLEEECSVMKEKLIYKWPGTSGYGAHRDVSYFNSCGCNRGEEIITVAVALDKTNEENGAIKFYPDLRIKKLKTVVDENRDIDVSELKKEFEVIPTLEAGDVVFFDGLIPHLSEFNRSKNNRRVYMITYIPKRYKNGREKYYRNRHTEQIEERTKIEEGEYFLG